MRLNPSIRPLNRNLWAANHLGKYSKNNMATLNAVCHEEEGGPAGVWREIKVFFLPKCFLKHSESFPDCQNVFCTWFGLYIIYI